MPVKWIPTIQRFLVIWVLLFFFAPPAWAQAEATRPTIWAQPVVLEHAENLYKINDDLYRAAQPSAEGMQNLESMGIRTIINLRRFHSDQDKIAGTSLTLIEIPTRTTAAADDDFVVSVLQAIRAAEKPVLVHCRHGADRTGLIMAMYRMLEEGWTKEDALAEMKNGGYGFHNIWVHIPGYINNVDLEKIKDRLNSN